MLWLLLMNYNKLNDLTLSNLIITPVYYSNRLNDPTKSSVSIVPEFRTEALVH